jgi:hypothetical protein
MLSIRFSWLLLAALTTLGCQASRETLKSAKPLDCQQRLALWESEFSKIPPGLASARIRAIEAIAGRVGEDPEQCASEKIRVAIQAERARLVMLRIDQENIPSTAVYTCDALSEGLKCNSSVADDTAHLGEFAVGPVILATGKPLRFEPEAGFSLATIRVYMAARRTLMNDPSYLELAAGKDGSFAVPKMKEESVVVAILKEPGSGVYDKFVWLAKPQP